MPEQIRIRRTGPAVRGALAELDPEARERFEREVGAALRLAELDLDLAGPDAVVHRWWVIASVLADPLTADERAAIERARAGDVGDLYYRTDGGGWAQR